MEVSQAPARLPKVALATAVVAFAIAAIGLLSAFQNTILIFSALVPLAAGIGILRKRVWSAYGFALFQLAQMVALLLVLLRSSSLTKGQIALVTGISLALSLLFFFAGKSLAASGARRGFALPWVVLACLTTLPLLFVQAFVMPTSSMEDTLLIGDRILVRVFPRVHPLDGSIVVFHYPVDRRQIFVKRVIGVPGDRLRIVSRTVYRNGSALTESYVVRRFPPDPSRDNLPSAHPAPRIVPAMPGAKDMLEHHVLNGEVVVPPGKYFVLGDNRDNSLDSRYWGFLDASDIIGQPVLIYDSEEPRNPSSAANTFSFRRKRWSRIFKFL